MNKVYRKVSCFKEFNNMSFMVIGAYFITGVVNLIAYKIGVIDITLDGYIEFIAGSMVEGVMVPFAFVYSLLQQIIPIIISILIFKEYNKSYYKKSGLINIIPISNKNKFINIVNIGVISFVLYIIISCTFGFMVLGSNNNLVNGVFGLLYKISGAVFTLFNVIIVDMLIRKGKFNKENRGVLYIIMILISMFIFMNIGMLVSKFMKIENGTSLICMIIISLQYILILKRIDKIKIN